MVLGALGRLTSAAIRSLARNLFPAFYERGISANQALQELREAGLGYRRQDFLADFRQGKSIYDSETRVRFVNRDKVPSEGILESMYHGVPDRYSFVFRATGTNLETGESEDRYFFYHRNSLDTRGNMEGEALDWAEGQSSVYGFDFEDVSMVEGYINPIWA